MAMTIEELNSLSKEAFVEAFGEIFEHSAWVAKKGYEKMPFSSLEIAFDTMKGIIETSSSDVQLALILEHPELGKRIKMSDASVEEQGSVGLDNLSPEDFAVFTEMNKRYMDKFQFPFIIAVRGKSKDDILESMKERVNLSKEEEFERALQEIYKIAKLRFDVITQAN